MRGAGRVRRLWSQTCLGSNLALHSSLSLPVWEVPDLCTPTFLVGKAEVTPVPRAWPRQNAAAHVIVEHACPRSLGSTHAAQQGRAGWALASRARERLTTSRGRDDRPAF